MYVNRGMSLSAIAKSFNMQGIMKEHCYANFRNKIFLADSEQHISLYKKYNGVILSGKYEVENV